MISSIKKILNPRHRSLSQDSGSSVRPERKLCILRIIQLILVFGYVPCIAHSSTSTGRWTYASIGTSVSLGSGAAALTCLLEMLYLCLRRQTYRRSSLQSHTKAICYLLLRMSGDACAAVLWFSAFVAALLPKRPDYRGFLQSPPYATWVASAVLALTECALFVATACLFLVIYRKEPIIVYSSHDQGIELGRRANTGRTPSRGLGMPT